MINIIMDKKPDGGPAYPQNTVYMAANGATQQQGPQGGMTLRDYFAAVAMAKFAWREIGDDAMHAKECYAIADAMLKARME